MKQMLRAVLRVSASTCAWCTIFNLEFVKRIKKGLLLKEAFFDFDLFDQHRVEGEAQIHR